MRLFAAGMLAAGLKDEAAAVYYSLLQGGGDRAQQVRKPTLHVPCPCHVSTNVCVDVEDLMVKSHLYSKYHGAATATPSLMTMYDYCCLGFLAPFLADLTVLCMSAHTTVDINPH